MGKPSENNQLVERLAEASDVKPKKAKRLFEALETIIELPDFPSECYVTFSHTKHWCGHPLCRDS